VFWSDVEELVDSPPPEEEKDEARRGKN